MEESKDFTDGRATTNLTPAFMGQIPLSKPHIARQASDDMKISNKRYIFQ
jgi:hypothetical protein